MVQVERIQCRIEIPPCILHAQLTWLMWKARKRACPTPGPHLAPKISQLSRANQLQTRHIVGIRIPINLQLRGRLVRQSYEPVYGEIAIVPKACYHP
jgi:hypothetical protein